MPSQKSNDGEYYDSVFAKKELRDELNQIALDNYGSKYSETLSPGSNEVQTAPAATPTDKGMEEVTEKSETQNKNEPFSEDDIPF